MGKKVRVFLGEKDFDRLVNKNKCKPSDQNCFFCDLLDCQYVQKNGNKMRVGRVRLYGEDLPVYFSPQEGCWLPYSA